MTGATNGVKEFDQGENLSQSSDVLALIDVYGLSGLAKIGHGYAKELEEEHYSASAPEELWLNGIATNSRTSGDALKYLRTSRQSQPDQLCLGRRFAVLIIVGDRTNASRLTSQSSCMKLCCKRAPARNSSSQRAPIAANRSRRRSKSRIFYPIFR